MLSNLLLLLISTRVCYYNKCSSTFCKLPLLIVRLNANFCNKNWRNYKSMIGTTSAIRVGCPSIVSSNFPQFLATKLLKKKFIKERRNNFLKTMLWSTNTESSTRRGFIQLFKRRLMVIELNITKLLWLEAVLDKCRTFLMMIHIVILASEINSLILQNHNAKGETYNLKTLTKELLQILLVITRQEKIVSRIIKRFA